MLMLALALAAPTPLSEAHQRDIACVVEVAIAADKQRRGHSDMPHISAQGKRWAGLVGARIVAESGQPRELVAFAMNEAAKARSARTSADTTNADCTRRMAAELAIIDAANAPLPKPFKAK